MKLLYISDSAVPSASPNSVHVMKMCQAFASLGYEVVLLVKNTTACLPQINNVYDFYAVTNSFKLQTYPSRAFKGSGMFYNLSLIWRSLHFKADIIYTRSITAAFLLLLYGRRVVFEVHEPFEGKGLRLRAMFKFIAKSRRLIKLVVITEVLRTYYVTNSFIDAAKIIVAHDAADPLPDVSPVLVDNGFKVGYIGSLYPGKGMEILLPLSKACQEVMFHIIGGSEQQIENIRRQTGHLNNVIFHGFKSQQELPGYVSSFDVLIAPYTQHIKVSEKRGANNLALWMSPLKLFEYMAAGKPIITTSLPVIQEILQHRKNAWLCRAENLDEWKEAIVSMQNNSELRRELAHNAFQDFSKNHTWEKRAEQILQNVV